MLRSHRFVLAILTLTLWVGPNAGWSQTLTPSPLDFGTTPVGVSSAPQDLTLDNDTGALITVTAITETGDTGNHFAVTAPPVPFDLAAGETATISVTCAPQSAGAKSATVTVTTSDGSPAAVLDCTGESGEIRVDPASVTFADVAVGGGGADTATVTIHNDATVADLTVTAVAIVLGGADFSITSNPVSGGPLVIAAGGSAEVELAFAPGTLGSRSGTLRVSSDDPDEAQSDVALTGDGIRVLRVSPLSIDFEDTPMGEASPASAISICNDGVDTIQFASPGIELMGIGFESVPPVPADGSDILGGACATYSVRFAPGAASAVPLTGSVVITTNAAGDFDETVSLSGQPLSVTVAFDPSPVAFGDVAVTANGTTQEVTFTNTGQSPITVTGATVANNPANPGVFSRVSGDPSQALAASGGSLSITVGAEPVDTGSATGTLTVNYQVRPGNPRVAQVALSLSGTSAEIMLSGNSLDFGLVDADNVVESRSFTITNTGDATLNITGATITGDDNGVFSLVSPLPTYQIAPAGMREVVVAYDPDRENLGEDATLQLTTNLGTNINIALTGEGIDRRIEPSPRAIVFDDTFRSPTQPTVAQLEIRNTGRAPLAVSMILVDDGGSVFSVRTPTFSVVPPSSSEIVEIEFSPDALSGEPFTGTLLIVNDDDMEPMAEVTLSGQSILPNVAVSPEEIDFGSVGVGVSSEVGLVVPVIRLVNLDGQRTFDIRELRVVDRAGQPVPERLFRIRGLSGQSTQVGPDGFMELELEFNPAEAGEFEFFLQVFVGVDPLPVVTAPIRARAVEIKLRGGGCQSGGDAGLPVAILGLLLVALARRRIRGLGAALALVSLLVPASASAQATRNLDLGTFQPTLGSEADFVTVDNALVGRHLDWTLGLGFNWAKSPLVVESEQTSMTDRPVDSRMEGSVFATLALLSRFELGVRASLLSQTGDAPMFSSIEPADGTSFADVAAQAKVKLVSAGPLALAALVGATIPTANDQEFAGAAGFSGLVSAITGVELGRVRVAAKLGYRVRENGRLADVVQGDEIAYGLAGSFLVARDFQVIGEMFGALGVEGDETGGISPLEGVLGARLNPRPSWGITAGVGRGLLSGIGAPAVRGFLMLSVSPGRDSRAAPRAGSVGILEIPPGGDEDGDGVLNRDDMCPRDPEDRDDFRDEDGCPEPDNDDDGLADSVDRCPLVPEDLDNHLDDDGCPEDDNDGDGIRDDQDRCPDEPEDVDGFEDEDGCDDFDNDRDGVPDLMDACPTEKETINGKKDEDGCPDSGESAVMILNDQISLLEPVSFEGATAELTAAGQGVLAQVAAHIRANPDMKKVEIEVHVHPRGEGDLELSRRRAEAIADGLVRGGVTAERFVMKPMGSSQPITRKAKAAHFNDRLMIRVLP